MHPKCWSSAHFFGNNIILINLHLIHRTRSIFIPRPRGIRVLPAVAAACRKIHHQYMCVLFCCVPRLRAAATIYCGGVNENVSTLGFRAGRKRARHTSLLSRRAGNFRPMQRFSCCCCCCWPSRLYIVDRHSQCETAVAVVAVPGEPRGALNSGRCPILSAPLYPSRTMRRALGECVCVRVCVSMW